MAGNENDPQVLMDAAIRVRTCLGLAWEDVAGDCSPAGLATMCTRTRSSYVHDAWTARLQADFASESEIDYAVVRGAKQLVHPRWKMRFKKARPGSLLVAGNRTRQSREWIQRPFAEFPRQVPLSFVYRPDRLFSRIEVAGVAWQVNQEVVWFMRVDQMQDDTGTSVTGIPTIIRRPTMQVRDQALEERQAELLGNEGGLFDDTDFGGATG